MSEDLILRAAALARTAPREWSEFVAGFRKHANQVKESCISAPLQHLPTAQGRAQQVAADLKLMEECVKSAEALLAKRK